MEEGEVLPSKPRPTDNITGKEVVVQSSRKPVKIKPPLEATPMQLHRHRAEIVEDLAFFTSKTIYGVKHGWARGKFQGGQSPVKATSSPEL